jgi:PAS domain S-box-containing protein
VSDNVAAVLGYSPEEICARNDFWKDVVHPDDRSRAESLLREIGPGESLALEYRVRHKDGHYVWLRDELRLEAGSVGSAPHISGVFFDITAHKRFEATLRESESKYSTLFHQSNDAILIHDLEGNIVDVNQRTLDLFGFSRAEIFKTRITDLHPSSAIEISRLGFETIQREGSVSMEIDFKKANGDVFPAEVSSSLVELGGRTLVQGIVRDITERKSAEKRLRSSEAKNKAILSALPDIMFQVDSNGTFLAYHGDDNDLYVRPERFLGRTMAEVMPPELTEKSMAAVARALGTGQMQIYEYDLEVADELRHYETRMVPSGPGEVLCVIRDMTKRKRMEKVQAALFEISEATNLHSDLEGLLRKIRSILASLIDTTNFRVALYDQDSDRYSFPCNVDEYEGRCHPQDRLRRSLTDYVRRTGEPLLADEAEQAELFRSGEIEPVGMSPKSWLGVPLKTPDGILGVVVVQSYSDESLFDDDDIDLMTFVSGHVAMAIERKRADLLLRQSERKYRSLFETVRDGICITDIDDRFVLVNPAAAKIFGYSREELVGTDLKTLVVEDDRRKLAALSRARLRREDSTHELAIRRNDGELRHLFVSAAPYLDSKGEVIGTVAILADISESKRAERERQDLRERLASAQRMQSLGVLAGGVAHDLNNILGPLVGYPQLIMEQLPGGSAISKHVATIEKSARRAADIVQDLLTLARRGRYEMTPLDLNEVIENYLASAEFHSLHARFPEIEIERQLATDLPKVHGSAAHLSKVAMNLTLNAVDAMPNGGTLTVRTECSQIDKLAGGFDNISPGKYVIFSVSDTGVGIPKESIRRIFEPFYSTKQMGRSGSGLGLAVVYGVAKDHDGYVDVRSRLGKGSDFLLYLPAVEATIETRVDEQQVQVWGNERILVVDDIGEQRQLASTLLGNLGYLVETSATGREAVDRLRREDFDLVVLDMIMEPDFDGLDTYREIIGFKPEQKAIIVSGFSETQRVRTAEKLGVALYLKKPYTMQQLGRAIREALARKCESNPTTSS